MVSSSSSSSSSSSKLVWVVVLVWACFVAQAQNQTQPTLLPSEAAILNSVFEQWGKEADSSKWNISGEPCSGAAIDSTSFDDPSYNPFIKCDCSFDNGTSCRITQLKVYALDAVGVIPEDLYSLTSLINLNLGQNYLTGTLSPSIGNLTGMQYMSLGINALSGELPKELGKLTELLSLSFGSNNFSGPLPSELGNLVKLQQLYFDSAGVSGPIPSSFAKLQNLQIMWASDNALTGRIPDFIGNWTKLTALRFEGNSLEGPIPSSISNLTSLTDLRISDLANGSSSLTFIENLNSLNVLILRNGNISGSIPSDIWGNRSLSQLDLSFNNLNGSIPDSLFSITTLNYLFLGNNKLTGSLPATKSASLRNIDLSYNSLSGSFPSWVNNQSLQLNLVANNFTLQASNTSNSLSGLNCLQKNFPCNRGSGRYSDFAIKSGGPQIRSNDGTVYESENETLGAASHYMTDTSRWAVSNVGLFGGSNNPTYTYSSSSQFTNTLDSELFQTARLSASSLRYYGLGLENGNYTVSLQFAETAILSSTSQTWKSRGRRVFDIYIQGKLVAKDFDIQKQAGGIYLRAVAMEYKAQVVTENYLEIHFFWAGKGTCCIPAQGTYGPLVSAVRATPEFTPTVSNNPPSNKKNHTGLIVGIVVGLGVAGLVLLFLVFFVQRRRRRAEYDAELIGIDARPYTFSYAELKAATEDFKPDNKLGEGGFGPVYKGTLHDGRVIAVKQLSVASHQGKSQFVAEIATISAVQHRNLVKLYGCCIEGDKRLLVYEYLVNKSLDQALFGKGSLSLDWSTRFDICVGVARGLAYLHEESRLRIVHRDVKASNILLDADLVPKISDFGLAKLYDDKKTHISTRVAGTIGYLAPEYAMRGHLTEKTDVFAFGVVALELVSGRLNSDSNLEDDKIYLLELAWNLHEDNSEVDLVDQKLSTFSEEEVRRVIGVGLLCTQTSPMLRPPMSRVVAMLTGDIEVSRVTTKPGYLTDWRFDDSTTFMSEDATRGTDTTHSSSAASTMVGADHQHLPPTDQSKPMLHEIIGEGR